MPSQYYPDYVNSGVGLPVFRGPYMQQDAKLACFLFKAGHHELTGLCNKYLNEPMGQHPPYLYKPIPITILIYADMKVSSLNEEDKNVGWMPEIDLSFWVPILGLKRVGDLYLPDHFAFFLPYLYVNNSYAIATGREVYGFRKTLGIFDSPDDIRNPELKVKTRAFKTFSQKTEGVIQPLMEMERVGVQGDPPEPWRDQNEAGQAITKLLAGNDQGTVSVNGIADPINLFDHLNINVPIVFLKQFRDIANTSKAAYQAIVKAPATLTAFHGGGLLHGQYKLNIQQLESHPLAADLGLTAGDDGKYSPIAGAWLKIDFPMQEGVELWRARPKKQKVAILGGGMGSMTTAFALTDEPGWKDKYDITIYQLGWRLGGKGASGRRADKGERIEGHGLHVWFGFYENAFRLIQKCYAELARPYNAPVATWEQAFQQQDFFVLEEFHNDRWLNWPIYLPPNDQIPGQGGPAHTIETYIRKIIAWLHQAFHAHPISQPAEKATESVGRKFLDFIDDTVRAVKFIEDKVGPGVISDILTRVLDLANRLPENTDEKSTDVHDELSRTLNMLIKAISALLDLLGDIDTDLRRLFLLLEFGAVNVIGMIEDKVYIYGLDRIDNIDYRAWLLKHGASETVAYSVIVNMLYDLAFAYPKGDTGDQKTGRAGSIGAGTGLHSGMLILLAYKGSVIWKMTAGMGDVIFAPIYQLLKARGVKFEFFTKVEELIPDPDSGTINEIIISRQATLKPGLKEYNPLIDVKGLPCWPSEPLYAQIEQGENLKAQDINLESSWTPWQPVQPNISLKKGEGFDLVVLGISIGAFEYICPKLKEEGFNPKSWQAWHDMLEKVQTVQTQAMQLWLKPPLGKLGWNLASPLLGAYAQPMNTWADMAQILAREDWPVSHAPKALAFFCGPLKDAPKIPPFSDHDFPAKEFARVRKIALDWLRRNIEHLWPNTIDDKDFNWDLLVDLDDGQAEARFNAQYFRANIDPTERYVLSVADSQRYRLKADESGLANLFLTGDWVNNGFLNVGAIEPTVIAGLQAARAITGYPIEIIGESVV